MRPSRPAPPAHLARHAVVAAALLASASLVGCGDDAGGGATSQPTTRPREAVSVRVAPVSREPIAAVVDFVGTLYGDEESLIAAKTSGRILETRADLGDRVDGGAVLSIVDPTDARLEVERRELALREALASVGLEAVPPDSFDVTTIATVRRAAVQAQSADARLERAKQLFEQAQPLISAQDYEDIQTQQAVARQDYDVAVLQANSSIATARSRASELAVAQQQLADTTIRAPLTTSRAPLATTRPAAAGAPTTASSATSGPMASGPTTSGPATRPGLWAVAERRVSIGEYVAPGSVAYRLITDDPVKLRAAIPERFLRQVEPGQAVSVWVDASDEPVTGRVSRVSPAVDVASRTFAVEMSFDNPTRRLKPGGFGRGQVTVGTRSDVATVPAAALYSFAGLDKVFTIRDGKAVTNAVRVVSRDDERVVVEGDLGGADQVITTNLARLATGDVVKVGA